MFELFDLVKYRSDLSFLNDELLYDLQIAVGLVQKEGLDYTFPHRSLQEYFAAQYIASLPDKVKPSAYASFLTLTLYDIDNKHLGENIINLLFRRHFYNLLIELDFNQLTKNFTIPLLKAVFDKFDSVSRMSKNFVYVMFAQIHIIRHSLIGSYNNYILCQIIDSYFPESKGYLFTIHLRLPPKAKATHNVYEQYDWQAMRGIVTQLKLRRSSIITNFEEKIQSDESQEIYFITDEH